MKKILLLLLVISAFTGLNAQDVACMPDTTYQNAVAGAYPLPFNNEMNGIAAFPACINEPYELVFTLRLSDSISIAGNGFDIISAQIPTTGGVTGLPEGINYFCNPPNCIFPDSVLGCIVLRGTPTTTNAVGDYDLLISGTGLLDLLGSVALTFPGIVAPGKYTLSLNGEGNCQPTTSVHNYLSQQISLANTPNPVVAQTTIEMTSLMEGDFQFNLFDMAGRSVYQQGVHLNVGYNKFAYDASVLEEGIYIYTLSDGVAVISEKMVISRNH